MSARGGTFCALHGVSPRDRWLCVLPGWQINVSVKAMPRAPSPGSGASLFPLAIPAIPLSLPSCFQLPDHFPVALALDLLLLPPTQGVGNITRCTACATVTQPLGHPLVGPGDRHDGHFVPCPHTAFDSTLLATTPMSPQATCLYVTMYVLCLCVRHGPHACLARWLHGFRPGVDPGCGDSEV